ncbi:hypothetical protein ACRC7T_14705 [Segnochrobactraceae bacterium EtOH-i3]
MRIAFANLQKFTGRSLATLAIAKLGHLQISVSKNVVVGPDHAGCAGVSGTRSSGAEQAGGLPAPATRDPPALPVRILENMKHAKGKTS